MRPRGGGRNGEVFGWVRSRAGGRQSTCPCGRACYAQSGKRKVVAGVTGSVTWLISRDGKANHLYYKKKMEKTFYSNYDWLTVTDLTGPSFFAHQHGTVYSLRTQMRPGQKCGAQALRRALLQARNPTRPRATRSGHAAAMGCSRSV